jgi:cytochrome P450
LGANLALLEIKMFLAMLAREVASMELASEIVEWNAFSMIPKPFDGALVRVQARK